MAINTGDSDELPLLPSAENSEVTKPQLLAGAESTNPTASGNAGIGNPSPSSYLYPGIRITVSSEVSSVKLRNNTISILRDDLPEDLKDTPQVYFAYARARLCRVGRLFNGDNSLKSGIFMELRAIKAKIGETINYQSLSQLNDALKAQHLQGIEVVSSMDNVTDDNASANTIRLTSINNVGENNELTREYGVYLDKASYEKYIPTSDNSSVPSPATDEAEKFPRDLMFVLLVAAGSLIGALTAGVVGMLVGIIIALVVTIGVLLRDINWWSSIKARFSGYKKTDDDGDTWTPDSRRLTANPRQAPVTNERDTGLQHRQPWSNQPQEMNEMNSNRPPSPH